MTDCALATRATLQPRRVTRRTRRSLPGIPRWTRWMGVTAVPLEPPNRHDSHARQAWVISAGVGTGHIAALVHDGPDADHRGSGD